MRTVKAHSFSTLAGAAIIASFCSFSSAWAIPVLSPNLANTLTDTHLVDPGAHGVSVKQNVIQISNTASVNPKSAQAEAKTVKDNLVAIIKQVISAVKQKAQATANKMAGSQSESNAGHSHWAFQSNTAPISSDHTPKNDLALTSPNIAESASDMKSILANNGVDVAQSANGVKPVKSQSPVHSELSIASLPEPGTFLLLAFGLAGLALARRRTN